MRLAVSGALRKLRGRSGLAGLRRLARTPERLLIVPQDIRTRDPTVAADIEAGQFAFAGRVALSGGASPFAIEPPSAAWRAELVGFGWLRHLQAAETPQTRTKAQALVRDWMGRGEGGVRRSISVEARARRVMSFLTQSPLILAGADTGFYRGFMRRLAQDISRVVRDAPAEDPRVRLFCAVAATYYALCTEQPPPLASRIAAMLTRELDRQILPDGGHVTRNPGVVLDLLLDLLPLRQAYVARRLPPPGALTGAIDRMTPMLRMMRHGDGAMALFNGMGVTPPDMVSAVLAYDDTHSRPIETAPHTGYQRTSSGGMTVLLDAGGPPRRSASREAHAGALAVEISDGIQRIVINCGAPLPDQADTRRAARLTAAHSTLTIADRSSATLEAPRRDGRPGEILVGPRKVVATRAEEGDTTVLTLSQDGYVPAFGLLHRREIRLGGGVLEGLDRLEPVRVARRSWPYALRFHLHPSIGAAADGEGAYLLESPRGRWRFRLEGAPVKLEESVLLASLGRPRPTLQIVAEGDTRAEPELRWRLERA